MLNLLQQHNGRLRVDWAVGVGKSHNIDLTIEEAVVSNQYNLVIALFPTRADHRRAEMGGKSAKGNQPGQFEATTSKQLRRGHEPPLAGV